MRTYKIVTRILAMILSILLCYGSGLSVLAEEAVSALGQDDTEAAGVIVDEGEAAGQEGDSSSGIIGIAPLSIGGTGTQSNPLFQQPQTCMIWRQMLTTVILTRGNISKS